MTDRLITARNAGLIACRYCHSLSKPPEGKSVDDTSGLVCPTCGSRVRSRINHSLDKTAAFLLAAILLYIPANTLPIMSMNYLGQYQADTILSGVIDLIDEGLWPIAAIVFVASIIVPIVKLVVLSILVLSVHFGSRWRPLDRTRAYRITEFIGRWSMVDIFVIAILVALVQFGKLATVYPGFGAIAFAAVVILTIFAANTFDPRLIWDVMEHPHAGTERQHPRS